MSGEPQSNLSAKPHADFAIHALASALPTEAAPPAWITIFPRSGPIDTRDDRRFTVDPAALISRFQADGVAIPIDVNHSTHHAARTGARADAVGWVTELRLLDGALQGKVDWLDEGKSLLAARSYKFVSPDFFHTSDGVTTWLRSVALVTAPALGNQKALASASSQQKEATMKNLASALGAIADANEEALLAALTSGFVPKKVHEETCAALNAAKTELENIAAAGRKARVDALLEDALEKKKIVPAERDHYATLCATDAGFESVKALLAAKPATLQASGLDDKKVDDKSPAMPGAAQLAAEANKLVTDGKSPDFLSAMADLEKKYLPAA